MKQILSLFVLFFAITLHVAKAQCPVTNTAFQGGETLMYDLYFNWKFVWVKAGTASMNISRTVYDGEPAYRTRLITRGSKNADKFFIMRDTLTSYVTGNLVPLYFRKGAEEGSAYRIDEVWYNYSRGKVNVKQRHVGRDKKIKTSNTWDTQCVYDMLSMLLRSRSFDTKEMKKGHRIRFTMADGKGCDNQVIVFRGRETFKMENSNVKYRCLKFSFVENEDGKEKEVITFYVTDDKNHLPVRLDMFLRFGSAKAFLTGARGVRNPQTAKIR